MPDIRSQYLRKYFDEVEPEEFYRYIFGNGELQDKGIYEKGKYNGIAIEMTTEKRKNGKPKILRYSITNDLDIIDELVTHDNFILMSPVSYAGKTREGKNARMIYALAIDLDGVNTDQQISDLFYQMDGRGPSNHLPEPTYVVSSGNGVHLYYIFEKPIPCFKNINQQMHNLKQNLTKKIWNDFVTDQFKAIQYQSIFQGFRLVGSKTKQGNITRAFKIGKKVSVEYLNEYVEQENQVTEFAYKSDLRLDQAKGKYPDWYDKRIVKGEIKRHWTNKRDLYDWWKRKLSEEVIEGHRYYGLMCLAVYAKKCGVSEDELEKDAFDFMDILEEKTNNDDNHFTEDDVISALEMYNDDYITFPIKTISELTGVRIDKNKRNGRKQEQHLKIMRGLKKIQKEMGEEINEGRPKGSGTKEQLVKDYIAKHPADNPTQISKALGISRPTVYKYMK